MSRAPRLLLVTDRRQTGACRLEEVVTQCVAAGIDQIFLRERDLPLNAYDELLTALRHEIGDAATIFTRAPRPQYAACHLADRTPMPADRPAVVGRSIHDNAGVRRAAREGPDYVLAGPFAPTASKPGHGPALGLAGLRTLLHLDDCPPLLTIGGVRPDDLAAVAAVGAHGVAVMGPLMRAARPADLAAEYVAAATASWIRT